MSDNTVSVRDIQNLDLSDDDRLLFEAGFVYSNGELTDKGRELALLKAFRSAKDEIVSDIKKVKANKAKENK